MTEKQILEMLKELVQEIDYDTYKSYFVYDLEEDDEGQDPEPLVEIVQRHLKKSAKKGTTKK
jgi:ferritin-like metal-binding protein YciE